MPHHYHNEVLRGDTMNGINPADTLFVLISAALVMLMTPGLAFFYGGIVRKKNILSVLMHCFAALCLLSVFWVLIGYSLAFAPGNGFWGDLRWVGLSGVDFTPFADYSTTVPNNVFMIYQGMFAVITPALIAGAFAERIKFSAYLLFILLWSAFVYAPVCHWVWGSGGWLKNLGVQDFAGGIVVHATAGIASIVTALMLGERKLRHAPSPHNLPLVVLGTGLLWFGWFGFNAGSALGVNATAADAFIATNTAAAMAGLTWCILEWIRNGKPTVFGIVTGAIAGLATVTPAAGFISPLSAMAIGFFAAVVCFISIAVAKPKFGYDDTLDAFGVHGVGGILGSLLVGVYASKAINPASADGLLFGGTKLIVSQCIGVGVTIVYTLIVTWVIVKLINVFLGMRVTEKDEFMGLDLTQHRERAYTVIE
jgi:Amt family ammonium transporter